MNTEQNFDPVTGQPINSEVNPVKDSQPTSEPANPVQTQDPVVEESKGSGGKVLLIIGCVILGFIILGIVIFFVISSNSNKLVCTSSQGTITLMYNDNELTGYKANGIGYDYDQQSDYAKQVGIDEYLNEFSQMFSQKFAGACEKIEK